MIFLSFLVKSTIASSNQIYQHLV